MKFQKGDIVRYHDGKVDWEVVNGGVISEGYTNYILKSGMSGRMVTAWQYEIRPWVPHE